MPICFLRRKEGCGFRWKEIGGSWGSWGTETIIRIYCKTIYLQWKNRKYYFPLLSHPLIIAILVVFRSIFFQLNKSYINYIVNLLVSTLFLLFWNYDINYVHNFHCCIFVINWYFIMKCLISGDTYIICLAF